MSMAARFEIESPRTVRLHADRRDQREPRFVGKTIQVSASNDVCQNMGCWMNLVDPNGAIRFDQGQDGEIEFPTTAVGKVAIAEGKFAKLVLSKEQAIAQAKHEAEENGRKFDPKSITSGKTIYQIDGAGAVILE
jgi:hypothetical protein